MPLTFMSHLHLHERTDSDYVLKQDHPIPLVSVVPGAGAIKQEILFVLEQCIWWSQLVTAHTALDTWARVDLYGQSWSQYTLQRARGSYNQSLKSCNISSSQSDAASVPQYRTTNQHCPLLGSIYNNLLTVNPFWAPTAAVYRSTERGKGNYY